MLAATKTRLAFVLSVTLGAACGGSPPPPPSAAPQPAVPVVAHAPWGYTGVLGPESWASLSPEYASCASGQRQSPMALSRAAASPAASVGPAQWAPVPVAIENNGHTVQVTDKAPSTLVLDGVTYALVQFHAHVPAEHTLDGRVFDAELHLVHRSEAGALAVVAVFLQAGDADDTLRPFFDALPLDPGPARLAAGSLDIRALLPPTPRFLAYDGSLTTPPCTEGVHWLVTVPDPHPLGIRVADLARLRAAIHGENRRPAQPANGRTVGLRSL